MVAFLVRWAILSVAVWVAAKMVDGIHLEGWESTVLVALILGLLNALVKPVLLFLSLPVTVVRAVCGPEFLIGSSTHSLETARDAHDSGADFVVFGPVFETESKREFGPPQGLNKLQQVASGLQGFPVVAIGGITATNAEPLVKAGADFLAVCQAVWSKDDPGAAVREFEKVLAG